MKFFTFAIFAIFAIFATFVSLITCSPAGTPTAVVLAARATLAPEIPQFPRTAVTCGIDMPHLERFTRPYYVKSAYRILFHRNKREGTFYTAKPKTLARVVCFLHAGIFVENTGDKPVTIPYATIADMARTIVYASCNHKKGYRTNRVNGMQADTRDNFAVIVAYSSCRKGPPKGISAERRNTYANKTGP